MTLRNAFRFCSYGRYLLLLTSLSACASKDDVSGNWTAHYTEGSSTVTIKLVLDQKKDGTISGSGSYEEVYKGGKSNYMLAVVGRFAKPNVVLEVTSGPHRTFQGFPVGTGMMDCLICLIYQGTLEGKTITGASSTLSTARDNKAPLRVVFERD